MTTSENTIRLTGLSLLISGCRPRTLTIAASPVIAAGGLAFFDLGHINPVILTLTLIAALAIQAGTNLYNDAADGLAGNDTPARLGPARLTAQGLASPAAVKRAALLCFALAATIGLYLISLGGWPILLIGILSIASGYAYSSGPLPISHMPFGEIFVIGFFGVLAVSGTYYLQTGSVTTNALIAGLAIGFFGAAVLLVNNHRDRLEDKMAGRKTLAIWSGPYWSGWIFSFFLITPFALQFFNELQSVNQPNWLPLMPLPFALFLAYRFHTAKTGHDLNMLLVQSAKLQFAFSVLFAVGAVGLKLG